MEALRDLVRARENAKKAERVARQQLLKFLLRHERRYPGKTNWMQIQLESVRRQRFEAGALQSVTSPSTSTLTM